MHWNYEAPGMCDSLVECFTHLQKIVTDRLIDQPTDGPTNLGTEAPSPELKKSENAFLAIS